MQVGYGYIQNAIEYIHKQHLCWGPWSQWFDTRINFLQKKFFLLNITCKPEYKTSTFVVPHVGFDRRKRSYWLTNKFMAFDLTYEWQSQMVIRPMYDITNQINQFMNIPATGNSAQMQVIRSRSR